MSLKQHSHGLGICPSRAELSCLSGLVDGFVSSFFFCAHLFVWFPFFFTLLAAGRGLVVWRVLAASLWLPPFIMHAFEIVNALLRLPHLSLSSSSCFAVAPVMSFGILFES